MEWAQARAKLLEFATILRSWDQKAKSGNSRLELTLKPGLDGFVQLTVSPTVDLRLDLRFLARLRERVTVQPLRKAMI